MTVCQAEVLPIRLHRIHLPRFEEVLRDLQLAHIQRPQVLGLFTERHVGLLPRRLQALGILPAVSFAIVASLSVSVGMSVVGASQLPRSIGAFRHVLVPRARYVVVIASFLGPPVGQFGAVVGAVFATPLDAHREGEGRSVRKYFDAAKSDGMCVRSVNEGGPVELKVRCLRIRGFEYLCAIFKDALLPPGKLIADMMSEKDADLRNPRGRYLSNFQYCVSSTRK